MKQKTLKNNEFNFEARITRAVKKDGKIILNGVASSDSVDWYQTRFNQICQENWLNQINSDNGVPVIMEINHDGFEDWTARCGKVNKAWTEPNPAKEDITDFHIEAEIMATHYLNNNDFLFNAINNPQIEYGQPKQMALSINGFSKPGEIVMIDNQPIEDFSECTLFAIGIVEYGANPDTYVNAIKRSIAKGGEIVALEKSEVKPEIENKEVPLENETRKVTVEKPNTERVKTEADKNYIQEIVDEVNQMFDNLNIKIEALNNSDLEVEDTLCCIKMFAERFSNNSYWEFCEGMWDYDQEVVNPVIQKRDIIKEKVKLLQRKINDSKLINDSIKNENCKEVKMASENQSVAPEVKPEATIPVERNEVTVPTTADSELLVLVRSLSTQFGEVKTSLETVKTELADVKKRNVELETENETVKREKAAEVAKVAELSQIPSSQPAIQNVGDNTVPVVGINREALIAGLQSGKFDSETEQLVRTHLTLANFNIKV